MNQDLALRVSRPGGAGDDPESKSRVLLERLRAVEAEKSALVLENETQRGQYEKCLDQIANQVRAPGSRCGSVKMCSSGPLFVLVCQGHL